MFNRVLLIQPPSSSYLGAARPPTGLGYLSQALQEKGIDHQVIDMRVRDSLSRLRDRIKSFNPDLVGVSLVSYEYKRSYELIRQIRLFAPGAAIVGGGPHVSLLREAVFDQCPELDLTIAHEGELSITQLCHGSVPITQVPGLLFRENGGVRAGPSQVVRNDLDDVSFPRYELFELKDYARERALITSRGCPYRCIFCANSLTAKKFRARSAANVADELEYWYARGIRQFNIDDDTFSQRRDRVFQICDEIEGRGMKDLFIRCANGLRADRVDRQLLLRMKEVGVREVAFGADGGNDRVLLEIVHKGERLQVIEQAVKDAIDLGMRVKLFLIVGYPGELPSDVEDSIALATRYPVTWVQLNNPIPYPGTELYEWVKKHNCFLVPPELYLNRVTEVDNTPVFETLELPRDVRKSYLTRCRIIERDTKRHAVERMFRKLPILGALAGWLFATSFGQWLFFKNVMTRSIINRIWYRAVLAS
jgi:anaerobic magnesium-protoporphyrin IX monomethyl ester cyclase